MTTVAIKYEDNYDNSKRILRDCFETLGGINRFFSPNMNVLIKPNLCCPVSPEHVATTHPLFIEALVAIAEEAGCNVYIGENSGGNIQKCTEQAFYETGMVDVLKRTNAKWINFQEEKWVKVPVVDGKYLTEAYVPEILQKMDLVINAPKLKSHNITILTGSIKNIFGCLNAQTREMIHRDYRDEVRFSHAILDAYQLIKPQLNFLDAIESMEGDNGPLNGNCVKTGFVLASKDGVAADLVAAYMTGHNDVDLPPVLTIAADRKIGETNLKKIAILGDPLRKVKFGKISYAHKTREIMFRPIISNRCVKCKACINSCPVNAISIKAKNVDIDYDKCIECLCCQEVCIHEAIDLERFVRKEKYDEGYDILRLESKCNLECVFCTANVPDAKSMTKEEIEEKICFLRNNGEGRIALTGGEPTLHPDILSVISFAKQKGLFVQLQTNAVLFNDDIFAKKFIDVGVDHFFISLHTHHPHVYSKITLEDKFNEAVQGIHNIITLGGNVEVNFVINRYNYTEMKSFACFAKTELQIDAIRYSLVNPNEYMQNDKQIVPSLTEINAELMSTLEYCHEQGIQVNVEGVPLCHMGRFYKNNIEWKRLNWPPHYHVESTINIYDCHRYNLQRYKTQGDNCCQCPVSFACCKVWTGYANLYGTDELIYSH